MNKMTTVLLLIGLFSSCMNDTIKIKPLYPYKDIARGISNYSIPNDSVVFKFFYIVGFDPTDKEKIKKAEVFAKSQLESDYKNYRQYEIMMYNKTDILNEHYKQYSSQHKDQIEDHLRDLVLHFKWANGKYLPYTVSDNGKIVQ